MQNPFFFKLQESSYFVTNNKRKKVHSVSNIWPILRISAEALGVLKNLGEKNAKLDFLRNFAGCQDIVILLKNL